MNHLPLVAFSVLLLAGCSGSGIKYSHSSVDVPLANAGKTVTYKAAYLVDGTQKTLSDLTIECDGEDEVAVLVINGGSLTLKNCTIVKKGDGKGNSSSGQGGAPGMPPGGKPDSLGGPGMPPPPGGNGSEPGPGGPAPSEDGYNFYGTNSAVVALGEGTGITLDGCTVKTDAEYANAVFSADKAKISVVNGIKINTSKNSSRGLYATCAGTVQATGVVDITTVGAHCAALATDRGGGFVTVGTPGTADKSVLSTSGDGSPSIYSTGEITAYNIEGKSTASQAIVVEGKNKVKVEDSSLSGNDPSYGGIMLYQSFSGDAETGIASLHMKNCTVKDNGGVSLLLVTNTEATADFENCKFVDKNGAWDAEKDYLVVCKNCNTKVRSWGSPGTNGGNVTVTYKGMEPKGKVLAAESDSRITVRASGDAKDIVTDASGKGEVSKATL